MLRHLKTLPALLLLMWAPGCIYDLDIEGKQCNTSTHICPSGYECVESEGEFVCKPKRDGGSNGGDQPDCYGDATECLELDDTKIRICSANIWVTQDCGQDEYCTDFAGQEKATCELQCTSHEECQAHGDGNFYCATDGRCKLKGTCVDDTNKPDENRCSPDGSKVVKCNSVTGWDEDVGLPCNLDTQYCDRQKAQCRDFCVTDSGCDSWPEESCNPETGRCETAFLCQDNNDCNDDETPPSWIRARCENGDCECTGFVCVIRPTDQCTTSGNLDMSCYDSSPDPPDTTPPTCDLEGRVVWFIYPREVEYNEDLEVRVHSLASILKGETGSPLASTAVIDDQGVSQYSLQGLPTNEYLVLEVRCTPGISCGYHKMYTFGLYLRANDCGGGPIAFSAPTISDSLWNTYSAAGGLISSADPTMGLFLGRLRECSVETNPVEKGTGDVSMSREIVFYIPTNPPIKREDTSTLDTGFFGAANVLPIRGFSSALVRDQGSLLSLRTYEIRIFAKSASLVFFDKPKKPW